MNLPIEMFPLHANDPGFAVTATRSTCAERPITMKARLRALLKEGWVTPLDALNRANCLSLSQRIGNFRSEGVRIEDKWVDLPSGKQVKAYRIEA